MEHVGWGNAQSAMRDIDSGEPLNKSPHLRQKPADYEKKCLQIC